MTSTKYRYEKRELKIMKQIGYNKADGVDCVYFGVDKFIPFMFDQRGISLVLQRIQEVKS